MPSVVRQWSTSAGSGPASTTTAVPSPAASTVASPCPTSHIANRQPGGGHPVITLVSGAGRTTTSRNTRTQTPLSQGCFRSRRPTSTTTAVTTASSSAPGRLAGQSTPPPGSAAPVRAMSAIHRAGQLAHHASPLATGSTTGAVASVANPSTVAGATANSASRLHGTATRLTRADRTATTGAHRACAAPAAASASARRGGIRRLWSAALHRGASVSRAPVASTESRKP